MLSHPSCWQLDMRMVSIFSCHFLQVSLYLALQHTNSGYPTPAATNILIISILLLLLVVLALLLPWLSLYICRPPLKRNLDFCDVFVKSRFFLVSVASVFALCGNYRFYRVLSRPALYEKFPEIASVMIWRYINKIRFHVRTEWQTFPLIHWLFI